MSPPPWKRASPLNHTNSSQFRTRASPLPCTAIATSSSSSKCILLDGVKLSRVAARRASPGSSFGLYSFMVFSHLCLAARHPAYVITSLPFVPRHQQIDHVNLVQEVRDERVSFWWERVHELGPQAHWCGCWLHHVFCCFFFRFCFLRFFSSSFLTVSFYCLTSSCPPSFSSFVSLYILSPKNKRGLEQKPYRRLKFSTSDTMHDARRLTTSW